MRNRAQLLKDADEAVAHDQVVALRRALERLRARNTEQDRRLAALLEVAKDALEVHERMHGKSTMAGDLYVSQVLREAIAEAEKEAV